MYAWMVLRLFYIFLVYLYVCFVLFRGQINGRNSSDIKVNLLTGNAQNTDLCYLAADASCEKCLTDLMCH